MIETCLSIRSQLRAKTLKDERKTLMMFNSPLQIQSFISHYLVIYKYIYSP